MTYFRICSVLLGVLMVLGGCGVSLFPAAIRQWAPKLYSEKRPRWLFIAGMAALALMIWTWIRLFMAANMYAFAVTLVVSLTASKILWAVFFYRKFREITLTLLGEILALRVVMMSTAAIGVALLILGLFL